MTKQNPLSQLEPNDLWQYFYELTQIPRPSHHEEAIQNFIMNFGQSLKLETKKDNVGNIIIKKPASKGMEDKKGVILQSHLDMVPQANKDTEHDFLTDPIRAYIDTKRNNEWVTADGTTLGADNGMGVAAIMAVLADDTLEHGNIEALFTSTEETGMVGAFGLQAGQLVGDILLNLDSEDEGELYVGCAGGIDVNGKLAINREIIPKNYSVFKVVLNGLKGGHSGLDINKQRGNANKLLNRWLLEVNQAFSNSVRLIDFQGGNLRNAIPREAEAVIAVSDNQLSDIQGHLQDYKIILDDEYQGVEQSIRITMTEVTAKIEVEDINYKEVLTIDSQAVLLNLINASPNGVYRMSVSMDDLVETSCNLAIISTNTQTVSIKSLIRGSLDSTKSQIANEIVSLFELTSGSVELTGEYPGWQPNPESQILKLMIKTGEQLFGYTPEIKGIHAGLECGILGRNYPNWDMISFGPTIRGAHSPDERVHIKSVQTFYQWLLETLKHIPSAI